MNHALRFLTAIAISIGGLVAPEDTAASGDQPARSIELIGLSVDEQAAALHDVELFAEAGLPLPPVVISRHHDRAACSGHQGLHHLDGARSVIDICTGDSGRWEARTILHELAHAWAFHSLTAERKDAFQQLRGRKAWLDYNASAWEDNGAEQAAEIIVWGLSDYPLSVIRIDQRSCSQLRAGYVALTGLAPLHGYGEYCDGRTNTRTS